MFSLQMMEHLTDPIRFLYNLSKNNVSEYMLFTVPYVSKSRVGLKHLRQKDGRIVSPEECHIFELSPSDWELVCKFSGWEVIERDIYLQYPPFHLLSFTKPLWRIYDFEGFCGFFKRKFDLTRQYGMVKMGSNRVILITGSSTGIGFSTLKYFYNNNWNIIAHYYEQNKEFDEFYKSADNSRVISVRSDFGRIRN